MRRAQSSVAHAFVKLARRTRVGTKLTDGTSFSETLRRASAQAGVDLSGELAGKLALTARLHQTSNAAPASPRGGAPELAAATGVEGVAASIGAAELEQAARDAGADEWTAPALAPSETRFDWDAQKAEWKKKRDAREAARAAAFQRRMRKQAAHKLELERTRAELELEQRRRISAAAAAAECGEGELDLFGDGTAVVRAPADADFETPAPPAEETPAARPRAGERAALTRNPRILAYWRKRALQACVALHKANHHARRNELERLEVPHQVHQFCHDVCDDTNAAAGALEWIKRTHGAGVAIEADNAALFRERKLSDEDLARGMKQRLGVQRDDWSCPRARRKLALIAFFLMAPFELPRSAVTGSTSKEMLLVTAGVPQTLLALLLRSGQREPYCSRTVQRDLAEIDACTDLLLRWRTPVAHAQAWERRGNKHGVVNRYCVRAGMIREQWRRMRDAGEALIKQTALRLASWMLWQPSSPRGTPTVTRRGGLVDPVPT